MPSSRDLTNLGIEPRSPILQVDSLQSEPPGKLFTDCRRMQTEKVIYCVFTLSDVSIKFKKLINFNYNQSLSSLTSFYHIG